ncbi:MAG: hypothetical protein U9O94_00115 [Nanoarchaeota archaeon]|nr:hypothetical protein [Nanoarchaeota archaeon]
MTSKLERIAQSFSDYAFKRKFKQFKYLGILDKYGVDWSIEKVARDTLQNFFDANDKSLDGVDIDISEEAGEYRVRISNHAEYDFRQLMHLGGTTKSNDENATGGFGEGTKILALSLLRDYEFSQVRFGSGNWKLDFLLHDIPKDEYVEKRKGLHAGLIKGNNIDGNFAEFKTENKEYAQAFLDARDLFFHSENEDFQNPSLDIKGIGGFKYLPREEGSSDTPKGNFYYIGQRRHFDEEKWNTVEHVNIWTYTDFGLKKDRDRGIVTRTEIEEKIIPRILDKAETEDLTRLIYDMKPIWSNNWSHQIGYYVLEGIAKRLKKQNVKLDFEDKYLATDTILSSIIRDNLEERGYILCSGFFADIGMKKASGRFEEMQEHYRVEASTEEEKKINILYEATTPIKKEKKDIWIFSQEQEDSIFQGQYDERFVWLSQERLQKPFHEAFCAYLHEIDHRQGNDYSAEFSYALTETMGEVIKAITGKPELYQNLERQWSAINS